jgi:hypothetical protein
MMMNKSNFIKAFLGLLSMVVIFHTCIILKVIPYNIAWGGRLTNDKEMYVFEAFSMVMNIFLAWLLLMKGGYVRFTISEKAVNIILWFFFVMFILNTIGNLFAKTNFEKGFTLLTGLSAILIWKIVKGK